MAVGRISALVAVIGLALTGASNPRPFSSHEKAFYADEATIAFVRPGLKLKVTAAQVAADGTISTTVLVTDGTGQPLDRTGASTPGPVSLSFIAATIPKGQMQYVAYTTRAQTSPITKVTANQAGADSGGSFSDLGNGSYRYTFGTKATSGFDGSATHTIGVYGSRNLANYQLGVNYASTTYNFVPNGSAVVITRDVVKTSGCNSCHDQLSAHGGSRRGVEMCVLCHTPQTVDPDTGNTVDFKVMVHKVHMGSSLPSVGAGKPYQIIGFNQSVLDWSSVVYPADVRRCETCHQPKSGAAQANAYLTRPSRDACGSCHDDVNFATGANHVAGAQSDDSQCATCHVPQGEIEFDASIKGAHVIPTESSMLAGLSVAIQGVQNGTSGSAPVVSFTVKDGSGNTVPLSALGSLSFTLAGPTTDIGNTRFGSDVTTPGYMTESAIAATCGSGGLCTYSFKHSIPADASGTFSIGVEARRSETILAGTSKQQSVQYGAKNQVVNFSVDGTPVAPRRQVVATTNCNQCHVALSVHGTLRNQTEYCVLCHNPANTDVPVRASAVVAADKALPPQGINFNLMVHRIHTGENLPSDRPYVIVGFGGSHNDFSDVRYPAMSATGAVGDTRNCSVCHVGGSEQNLPLGLRAVTDPQGPVNPNPAIASACTGCHATLATASHASGNTTILGESCTVCHSAGAAYAVGSVHAQY